MHFRKTKTFAILVLSTITVVLITKHFLPEILPHLTNYRTVIPNINFQEIKNQTSYQILKNDTASTLLPKFEKIRKNHDEKLSQFHAQTFKDSKLFLDYGPRLWQITKNASAEGKSSKVEIILESTIFFGTTNWLFPKICEGREFSCVVTTNKSKLLESDALFFHANDINTFPLHRPPHQRWVFFNHEPPYKTLLYSRRKMEANNNIFNWTMTYRWDSDFPAPYYNATLRKTPLSGNEYDNIVKNILNKKKKLATIMLRNCHPRSQRNRLVNELRQYLTVDYYGDCGTLKCPPGTKECHDTMSSYKFYLAIENSECREYISEKVANPFHEWDSVPIVYGAHPSDYAKILPPNSYIHVNRFASTKELADFIILLDKTPTLYAKYHEWRRHYSPRYEKYFTAERYCDLCQALFNSSLRAQTYRDLKGWYDQDTCRP